MKNKIEVEVPPDVPGLARKMEEVTGFQLELLLVQILLSNQPQHMSDLKRNDLVEFAKCLTSSKTIIGVKESNDSKLPFWFHLDPNFHKIFLKLEKKFENRVSRDELIELLMLYNL